ncbi:MAG: hypothetical protein RLN89_12005 [Parvibaculum sp.]
MSGLLLVLAIVIGAVVLLQLSTRIDPKKLAKVVRIGGAVLAVLSGLALTLAGRIGFAIPLFMVAAWLVGLPVRLPGFGMNGQNGGGQSGGRAEPHRPQNSGMTRGRALEILGLQNGATRDDIRRAHKMLMQKLHPDHGGSTHLAAEVNAAKDFLLGQ